MLLSVVSYNAGATVMVKALSQKLALICSLLLLFSNVYESLRCTEEFGIFFDQNPSHIRVLIFC